MCVCDCVFVCACTHICVGVYIYTHTHAHMYGCTHTRVYTCMCIYPTHSVTSVDSFKVIYRTFLGINLRGNQNF